MEGRTRESVRIAMIGAGSMANYVHYPSLASFADVEIVAICDLDPALEPQFARVVEGVRPRQTGHVVRVSTHYPGSATSA